MKLLDEKENTKLQFIFYYVKVFNVYKIHSPVEFYIYFSLNSLLYFSVFLFLFFLLFRCVLVMACNLKYFKKSQSVLYYLTP